MIFFIFKKYRFTLRAIRGKIYTDIIKQIMEFNNGIITSRMIYALNISREYLSILKRNKENLFILLFILLFYLNKFTNIISLYTILYKYHFIFFLKLNIKEKGFI